VEKAPHADAEVSLLLKPLVYKKRSDEVKMPKITTAQRPMKCLWSKTGEAFLSSEINLAFIPL